MGDFKLVGTCSGVIFEKDNKKFSVTKGIDGDIWFESSDANLSMDINFSSRNRSEWRSYEIFEDLLEHIVGKFVLRKDVLGRGNLRYKDFIDIENRVITWHSDSSLDNVLRISYTKEKVNISITKDPSAKEHMNNGVRIRTDGSEYGTYYQQFTKFYTQICEFERQSKPMQKKKTL